MKKGQIVKCVKCPDGEFTVGQEYEVLGARGDLDISEASGFFTDKIIGRGMNLRTDNGTIVYANFPYDLFGEWELVS